MVVVFLKVETVRSLQHAVLNDANPPDRVVKVARVDALLQAREDGSGVAGPEARCKHNRLKKWCRAVSDNKIKIMGIRWILKHIYLNAP